MVRRPAREPRRAATSPAASRFNVKGGRCEACQGDGVIKIEMHFLPDVYVTCDVCKGKRYNRETLEVLFKGKSIADVLDMTVEEALEFFKAVPRVRDILNTAAPRRAWITSTSASRRRRSRAARRSASNSPRNCRKRATGRTLYILGRADHRPAFPRRGRNSSKCCTSWSRPATPWSSSSTISKSSKTADWIIDLGPEGGDGGGEIVAAGTPEDIVREKRSYTGAFLKPVLARGADSAGGRRRKRIEAAE